MLENLPSSVPKIAISVGDCSGVGPEICLKSLAEPSVTDRCVPVLVGPADVIRMVSERLNLDCPSVATTKDIPFLRQPAIIDVGPVDAGDVTPGVFSQSTGAASYQAVIKAIDLVKSDVVSGIVTGPIQKEAWHLAGVEFPGHTELLARQFATDDFCMMLTSDQISCVLATIHIPLADVATELTTEKVLRAIRLGAGALSQKLGCPARVSVCGLNPHAGESGLFSHGEESDLIQPAIDQAAQQGIAVTGPLAPDTAFTPAMRRQTDVYVCMYHDQGLIPLKALSFDDAVNVTLGLPIVRTSVDHGTALDIAWQGKANHQSMLSAIRLALDLG